MAENATAPVRIGLVGCGNMGVALAKGILRHPELRGAFVLHAHDPSEAALRAIAELGAKPFDSALQLALEADILLLAVKPQHVLAVLAEMRPALNEGGCESKLILSIAAGVPLQTLLTGVNAACSVARVMPNTLAAVGEATFGLCFGPNVPERFTHAVRLLLSRLGTLVELDEKMMNGFTALAGCGPGYVFHFLENLTEAGVRVGLSRKDAYDISLSLLRGCAALAEQSGLHPAVLREQVSSPGGMTIAGVNHLDTMGARGHLVDAVLAAAARGREMEDE